MRSTKVATSVSASAILILTLSLGCASSPLGRSLNVGVAGLKVADWHSTNLAEAQGGREGNALVGSNDVRQAVVAVLGASVVIAGAALLETKQHPVWGHVVRVAAMAVWGGAVIHNLRLERSTR